MSYTLLQGISKMYYPVLNLMWSRRWKLETENEKLNNNGWKYNIMYSWSQEDELSQS